MGFISGTKNLPTPNKRDVAQARGDLSLQIRATEFNSVIEAIEELLDFIDTDSYQSEIRDGGVSKGTAGAIDFLDHIAASVTNGVAAVSLVAPYDFLFFFAGTQSNNQILARVILPRAVTIPAGVAESKVSVGTNATAQTVLTIKKNGVSAGTLTIQTNGTYAFTVASDIVLVAGDILSVHAPVSADATLADVSVTLVGTMV